MKRRFPGPRPRYDVRMVASTANHCRSICSSKQDAVLKDGTVLTTWETMSLFVIPERAEELFQLSKPSEGWLHLQQSDAGHFSLVFIVDTHGTRNQVLLGRKKRGFGEGKCVVRCISINAPEYQIWPNEAIDEADIRINGFGGKPERGERLSQCAAREVRVSFERVPTRQCIAEKWTGGVRTRDR